MYFATHWTLIIWVEIKTLQVLQQQLTASKESTRCMKSTRKHTHKKNKQEKLIKFDLLFVLVMMTGSLILVLQKLIGGTIPVFCDLIHWLYGYFYTGPVCFYQKSCKPCRWSHDLCDRSRIFEEPNDSFQWIILLFSYIKCFLWNNVKPRRVL